MRKPAIIGRAVQDLETWLKALEGVDGIADEAKAYAVLRGVLHQLRDRLTPEEATDLGAELPTLVRGIYYEAWSPTRTPETERNRTDFLVRIAERMHDHPEIDPEKACRAVFGLLEDRISAGEIDDVITMLPKDVQALWPEEARKRAEARQAA